MRLTLLHGRAQPDAQLTSWGFDGPELDDILYVHGTYLTTLSVGFLTEEAAQRAQSLTGWQSVDETTLELRLCGDMIVADGAYYGDFDLSA